MDRRIRHKPAQQKLAVRPAKTVEVRQDIVHTIAYSAAEAKRQPAHCRKARHRRRLHVDKTGAVPLRKLPLLLRVRYVRNCNQPWLRCLPLRSISLARPRIYNTTRPDDRPGRNLLHQSPDPTIRENCVHRSLTLNGGKGARGGIRSHASTGSQPRATLKAALPQVDAITPGVLPALHQRLQLTWKRGYDRNAAHAPGA